MPFTRFLEPVFNVTNVSIVKVNDFEDELLSFFLILI